MTVGTRPAVSVVIPTVLRDQLERAVRSVRSQSYDGRVEVVVVIDRPKTPESEARAERLTADGVDRIVWTGGGRGGGHARNLGISSATGVLLGLLDDDDEWLPHKLDEQVERMHAGADELVLSCRIVQVDPSTGRSSVPVPRTLASPPQRIEEYLFRRRRPSIDRAAFYTSTLLLTRELARRIPWDEDLPRHQDWDWLLRLQRDADAHFAHIPSVGVRIHANSDGSISASSDWESSLRWIQAWDRDISGATAVDFVTAQTLRYALDGRSVVGVRGAVSAVWRHRRLPAPGPTVIALSGLIPRRHLARALMRTVDPAAVARSAGGVR
ncbi:glycosyltransferase family 2 protein [Nakamurella flavida]|uniref:Glycosyltransferase family 2 protein n=1 Tax=Nakamurella flavida TaxID=363630 RepID=A0A938YQX3_9ACTN|nr:glycosyltransferase family 2 protein [Nakamurella flavida]MBM9477784.1 glycosyltransferase family 2 protein [Nakamurella flavida]MDP9779337.1 glycosyltransferase involved in cell wall biosynthesis [Nakamurella flavida]